MSVGRDRTALVVDDDDLVRFVTAELMQELGFEVLQADRGRLALEILGGRNDIALLLTDCRMPLMSGQELARSAAALYPSLKIVFVSGFTQELMGLDRPFLPKPFSQVELEQLMRREFGI